MIYLELASYSDFLAEIQSQKLKEIRMNPVMNSQPDQQGNIITEIALLLTASKGELIIRYKGIIGRDYAANQDAMRKLQTTTEKEIRKIKADIKRKKFSLKNGIYKFPQELS